MAEILSTLSSDGLAGTPTSGGGQYTLMSAWEAAQQGDLTGTGNVAGEPSTSVLECYKGTTIGGGWQADGSLDDFTDINGWTTGVGNGITLSAAANNANGGVVGAGFSLVTAGLPLRFRVPYISVIDLEVETTGDYRCIQYISPSLNWLLERCIFRNLNSTSKLTIEPNSDSTVTNCLLLSGTYRAMDIRGHTGVVVQNCTIAANGGTFGILTDNGNTVRNCVAVGSSTDFTGLSAGDSFNASGDSTAGNGTSGQTGVVLTDATDFVSPSTDDYNVQPLGLLDGTGADLSAFFTDDIAGNTRSVPWEIGAYEIASAPVYSFDNTKPIIAQTGTDGTPYTFQDGGDGTVASRFSAAGTYALAAGSDALPAGMTINATTGNPEGTPTEAVTRSITITGTKT